MFESFIVHWGYLAIGVGTFLEGEAVLVAAGALAHRGLLSLPLVMGSALIGSVLGAQVWFLVGRRFGRPFIECRPSWKARVARIEEWLNRFGSAFVVGFRFIYGIRAVTPVFLGASHYSWRRFSLLNVAGGVLWSIVVGAIGWGVNASLESLLRRNSRVAEIGGAVLVVSVLMWGLSWWLRRRWSRSEA